MPQKIKLNDGSLLTGVVPALRGNASRQEQERYTAMIEMLAVKTQQIFASDDHFRDLTKMV